jgi:RNA polymerase sigma-70 factor (ECF subfamily)
LTNPAREQLRAVKARPDYETDRALVERVAAGDLAAFENLFHGYWHALYRFAYRLLQSRDDAEEAVQTVFVRIWTRHVEFRIPGRLADYLYLATRNACQDRLRHEAVARRYRHWVVGEQSERLSRDGDTDRSVRESEIASAIERCLDELPQKRRQICELRFAAGLSYSEIARKLEIAPKTVETQIARGLKFLRLRLRDLLA